MCIVFSLASLQNQLNMRFREYLSIMGFATALGVVSWLIVFFFADPYTGGTPIHIAFFVTTNIALIGIFSILGTIIRSQAQKHIIISRHVSHAARQAILLSLLITVYLILIRVDYFRWWLILFVIILFTSLELFLLSMKRK